MKKISHHPFEFKGARAKRRYLCKRCGHTERHKIHRFIQPGSVEAMAQGDARRLGSLLEQMLARPSPFVSHIVQERSSYTCPHCGMYLMKHEREGSGVVHGCSKCKREWSEHYLKSLTVLQTPAGSVLMRGREEIAKVVMSPEQSQRLSEAAQEEASTGAKRSSLYPKGAKFPARYDLMWRNAAGMRRLAETWGEGFEKYGADNWLKGFAESVLISHSFEHLRLYLAGDKSEDHLGHCAWNILALCWIEENKPELLDLTKPEQKA